MSRIDESKPFMPMKIAVLAVSDTRSLAEDRSGQTLVDRIEGAGHMLNAAMLVRARSWGPGRAMLKRGPHWAQWVKG